ncbi:MAG TPA: LysM peptidoglycan-binding domain-containing protein [Thermodesulfovibrionales bacterium]|nr:LysM peptidoglycan-binding domain-containing protein [Thermodesulfovibrionales bacterium]
MHRRKLWGNITLLAFLLLLPCLLHAQETEYKDYTVNRGDTLWDISNKELNDSFLWPKVWKENPDVKNPDRIYPGQKIKIPLYLLQKEIAPATKPVESPRPVAKPEKPKVVEKKQLPVLKAEPKEEYIVNKHIFLASGYIAQQIPSVGVIQDTPTGRTIIGKDDYAFIKTDKPVEKGDKFYIFHVMEEVIHPKTGRKLGYLIDVVGSAEVIGQEKNDSAKAVITNAYADISTGYYLSNYYEVEPPIEPKHPRKPDISGTIVASKHLHLINVPYDIAYIDKGTRDGLEVGDLLATLEQGKHRIYNGILQVINPRETTSTVIIKKSTDALTKGDPVVPVKQE